MRLRTRLLLATVALCSACALGPVEARAQKVAADEHIEARYRVDLAGLSLGTFAVTARLNGAAYEVSANGEFSLLAGILYRATGTTASEGQWAKEGPKPSRFTVTFDNGSKKESRELVFARGAVTKILLHPRKTKIGKRQVPVTKDQLEDVLDPLSAAFLYAPPGGSEGTVCDRTVPVFDGKQRFDIVLKPKRTEALEEAPAGLSGNAAVCQVKYVPIGGYRPDHAGVKYVMANDDIEVWLVRLKGNALYFPYRIVMPTAWGTGTATLIEVMARPGDASGGKAG
ncbi:MAG TPA: DUF3108 domain-containing protein [Methyloceanibacter sp.]|nr:DUF3108 domain-containing protein [Methyloceanibacter sp.]